MNPQRDAVRRERLALAAHRAQTPSPPPASPRATQTQTLSEAWTSAIANRVDALADPDHSDPSLALPLHREATRQPPPPPPPPPLMSSPASTAPNQPPPPKRPPPSSWFDSAENSREQSPRPLSPTVASKAARNYSPDISPRPSTPFRSSPLQHSETPAGLSPAPGPGPDIQHSSPSPSPSPLPANEYYRPGRKAPVRPPPRHLSVGAVPRSASAECVTPPGSAESLPHHGSDHHGSANDVHHPGLAENVTYLGSAENVTHRGSAHHGSFHSAPAHSSTQPTKTIPSIPTQPIMPFLPVSTQPTNMSAVFPSGPGSKKLPLRRKSCPSLTPDPMMPPDMFKSSFNIPQAPRTRTPSITEKPFVCEVCGEARPPRLHSNGDLFNTCRICTQPDNFKDLAKQQKWCYNCGKDHPREEFLTWNGREEKVCKPHHTLTISNRIGETMFLFTRQSLQVMHDVWTWPGKPKALILLVMAYLFLAPWIVVGLHAIFSPRPITHDNSELSTFVERVSGFPTHARDFVYASVRCREVVCEIDGLLCDFFGDHTESLFGPEIFQRRSAYYFNPPCPAFSCSGQGVPFASPKAKMVLGYFLNNITLSFNPILQQYRALEKTVGISMAQYHSRVDELYHILSPAQHPTYLVSRAQILYHRPFSSKKTNIFIRSTRLAWNFYRFLRTYILLPFGYPDLQITRYNAITTSIRASLLTNQDDITSIMNALVFYGNKCTELVEYAATENMEVSSHLTPFSPEFKKWLKERPGEACRVAGHPQMRNRALWDLILVAIRKALEVKLPNLPPIVTLKQERG